MAKGNLEAYKIYEQLRGNRPANKVQLKGYVKLFLDIDIPDKTICRGHCSVMDYLWHCFNEVGSGNKDCVVWANRGGGKTAVAAIATLMDCLFKPGCQVRILGGSLEQSNRMYEYLTGYLVGGFEDALAKPIRKGKCVFKNGSSVEVLTQSQRNVRGRHIQKLRCDEVELFDKDVFDAAKFVTKSTDGIAGGLEVISTMHQPYGLMSQAVKDAEAGGVPVFKWCLLEVIEKCVGRGCSQCELWGDCQGRARDADGYLKIDDAIAMMRRSSRAGWESEILCRRPWSDDMVFGDFDSDVHVGQVDYDGSLGVYRALDFGFVNPFVCLWVQVDSQGVVRVIDEYIRSKAAIVSHGQVMKERTAGGEGNVLATFCDPAGAGVNDVSGTSPVSELRAMGIRCRYRRSGIVEGIELIRRALRDGSGQSKLIISPRCVRLIEAMQCYRYPQNRGESMSELPVKDGVHDHPLDALRYFFVNYQRKLAAASRRY